MKTKLGRNNFSAGGPYFILMMFFAAVCGIFAVTLKERVLYYLAGAQFIAAVLCYLAVLFSAKLYKRRILRTINSISRHIALSDNDTLGRYPMPVVVLRPDTDEIIWYNESFGEIADRADSIRMAKISDIVSGFSSRWLLEGKDRAPGTVTAADRKYTVYGCAMNSTAHGKIGATFWIDITELADISAEYSLSRPNVAIMALDNYADLIGSLSDTARAGMMAAIDEKVNSWAQQAEGLLFKTDRERYVFVFEERWLPSFAEKKFSVLEEVKQVTSPEGMPATISIGVGHGGATFSENLQYANQSMDMALSRGGDQAVVRDSNNFVFYGGRTREVEKQTRVRARVTASALGELLGDTSCVFIMGHKNADIDAVGAAAGFCCIARKRNVEAHIVLDTEHNDAGTLLRHLMEREEYRNTFISPQEVMLKADPKSLLVVVDTNRPSQVESRELLMSFNRIMVVDHHRRAADYIERTTLNYLEAFASSACELTLQLMQYLVSASDILKVEADALLGGIVLDTKSFSVRTTGRTFEAAAFARRAGADTVEVKKLFQSDVADTLERYDIVRSARMYNDDVAVSVVDHTTDRALAAKAADELLTISGINTSFVLYPEEDKTVICARSIGSVNVQVILEALGGGGNATTAGAQMEGLTVNEALKELVGAIDKYLEG